MNNMVTYRHMYYLYAVIYIISINVLSYIYLVYLHRMNRWPVKNPIACMREMAAKSLGGDKDIVIHTLMKWKAPEKNIFQAARFMIPHCTHPTLRKARHIMRRLTYPFIIRRREMRKVLIEFESLGPLEMYLHTYGIFPIDVMLGWCLVHNYLNTCMIRDILCSGRRVLC